MRLLAAIAPDRQRKIVMWAVGVAISLAFVAYLVPRTDWTELWLRLSLMSARTLLIAHLWFVLAGLCRSQRQRLLLSNDPPFIRAYAVVQSNNFVTASLPSGVGEGACALLVSRSHKVTVAEAAGVVLVERLCEAAALLFIFGVMSLTGARGLTPVLRGAPIIAGGLWLALLASLWLLTHPRLSTRLPSRATAFLERIRSALNHLQRPVVLLAVVLLTLGSQGAAMLATGRLLAGLGFEYSFAMQCTIVVLYLFMRLLPTQGVAGLGSNAVWWSLAMIAVGQSRAAAAAAGTALYALVYANIVVAALVAVLSARVAEALSPPSATSAPL